MKKTATDDSEKGVEEGRTFGSQMGPLLFLTWIFLLTFISRVVLSPLLPAIEEDLKIGHGEAGSLFFLISIGYSAMLITSGFVSSRINHRKTITLSALAMGGALLLMSLSHGLWLIRLELVIVGMAAGLYLPSGIAVLTDLVSSGDWGKAIAVHEFAPNAGFVLAPFLADLFLNWFSWRGALGMVGAISIVSGGLFMRFGKGGASYGEAPRMGTLRQIMALPAFWIMIGLFGLGIGSSFGAYSMIPLYLVSERRMDPSWANTLVGLSRISSIGTPVLAGWVTDRAGPKPTLYFVLLIGGLCTTLLGLLDGSWMVAMLFLQPMLAASFFPAAFMVLARMGSPATKNVAVSLTIPGGLLLGAGAVPAALGLIGEFKSFSAGFAFLGTLVLGGLILVYFLRSAAE